MEENQKKSLNIRSLPGVIVKLDKTKFYLLEQTSQSEAYAIEELSQADIDKINFSNNVMLEYMYFKRKKLEIKLNYDEFLEINKTYNEQMAKIEPAIFDINYDSEISFINTNRIFTNYINSCRIFIDHLDGKLNHKYGKESFEYKTFKQAKSYCYDNYFSYKFFYHLRNYAEHVDFPIHDVIVEHSSDEKGSDKEIETSFNLFFNRDELLKCPNIFKKIGNELKVKEEQIPVLPLVEEYEATIEIILDSLLIAERNFYINNMNELKNIFDRRKMGGTLYLLNIYEDEEKQLKMNFPGLRFDVVKFMIADYKDLDPRYGFSEK
ncbi:hypothetical protein EXU85_20325 [Spirosoma sp. KCTC 42546]|uniref:hypothetical protein n=1 Tax=Spirosoma sp. KCTC 42546 TaxID=2520506 RepID=UPI00115A6716|nr:hypothetical protein [Spirosoma sp. KCTC 42546]QDK80826.1 hypothetical protein EXU85_20325 [Spirosoma sp. KCTC 42546]